MTIKSGFHSQILSDVSNPTTTKFPVCKRPTLQIDYKLLLNFPIHSLSLRKHKAATEPTISAPDKIPPQLPTAHTLDCLTLIE